MDNQDDKIELKRSTETCQAIKVPTEDELTALKMLWTIKVRVRDIKKRVSELSNSEKDKDKKEVRDLEIEMKKLKIEWEEWEKKKEHAARERMILLGHEEP